MNAPLRLTTQEQLRLRVEDFLALADAGAIPNHERTELIDGSIYWVAPQHLPHSRMKSDLYNRLRDALKEARPDLCVLGETTVGMPPHDAPLPDVIVMQDIEGDGIIPLEAVRLLVEVSVSTLRDDLGPKLKSYAAHGVPEYWVADVAKGVLHQMWSPTADGYEQRETIDVREPLQFRTLDLMVS
jgi:Uma2 family endonuclease